MQGETERKSQDTTAGMIKRNLPDDGKLKKRNVPENKKGLVKRGVPDENKGFRKTGVPSPSRMTKEGDAKK
jgi:hypothetical protein